MTEIIDIQTSTWDWNHLMWAHKLLFKFIRRIIVTLFEKGGTEKYTTLAVFLYKVNM